MFLTCLMWVWIKILYIGKVHDEWRFSGRLETCLWYLSLVLYLQWVGGIPVGYAVLVRSRLVKTVWHLRQPWLASGAVLSLPLLPAPHTSRTNHSQSDVTSRHRPSPWQHNNGCQQNQGNSLFHCFLVFSDQNNIMNMFCKCLHNFLATILTFVEK